jgi:hypothetical protein
MTQNLQRGIGICIGVLLFTAGVTVVKRLHGQTVPGESTLYAVSPTSPVGRTHTRPSLDGAAYPELIPDTLAYHFFLREVAAVAATRDERRIEGFAKRIRSGSATDPSFLTLVSIANDYQAALELARSNDATPHPPTGRVAIN